MHEDDGVVVLACLMPHSHDPGLARLDLHYFHTHSMKLLRWLPVEPRVRGTLHDVMMKRVRAMLPGVVAVREAQKLFERAAPAGCLKKLVDPVAVHDACTLYIGFVRCLFLAAEEATCFMRHTACSRCGSNSWGYSCTPPVWTARRRRLARDHLDKLTWFCWWCFSRN